MGMKTQISLRVLQMYFIRPICIVFAVARLYRLIKEHFPLKYLFYLFVGYIYHSIACYADTFDRYQQETAVYFANALTRLVFMWYFILILKGFTAECLRLVFYKIHLKDFVAKLGTAWSLVPFQLLFYLFWEMVPKIQCIAVSKLNCHLHYHLFEPIIIIMFSNEKCN